MHAASLAPATALPTACPSCHLQPVSSRLFRQLTLDLPLQISTSLSPMSEPRAPSASPFRC